MHTLFVIGSAGAGKTTFCSNLRERLSSAYLLNLDPSQNLDIFEYDIQEFIRTDDVMRTSGLGPNASILNAFEEMSHKLDSFELNGYVIVDMPGQIEIYLHCESFLKTLNYFKEQGSVIIINIFDIFNFTESDKYLSSSMNSCIMQARVNVPILNLISKCDLFGLTKNEIEKKSIKEKKFEFLDSENNFIFPEKYIKTKFEQDLLNFLNLNGYSDFKMIDYDDSALDDIIYEINSLLQYYDDVEFKENF